MPISVLLSPARTTVNNSSGGTTAAFNPPAGLLVVCVHGTAGTQANPSPVISNNGAALTWTAIARATRTTTGGSAANNGLASIYATRLTASRSGMTVTANQNSGSSPTTIKPYVLGGVVTSGTFHANATIGRSVANSLSTTAWTSQSSEGLVLAAVTEWTPLEITSSDTTYEAAVTTNTTLAMLSGYRDITSVASQSVALDAAGTGAADWMWATCEILPQPTATVTSGFLPFFAPG